MPDPALPEGLMLLTRYPQPGRTKTRLIPHLGPEGAAQLQRQMTEHLTRQGVELAQRHRFDFQVHFTGSSLHPIRKWLGHEIIYRPQCEGDLGQRLAFAFHQGFAAGQMRLLAIGSDCPSLGEFQVTAALHLLKQHDLVLGPALDGGYYLIGLSRMIPDLFEGISWGSERVLRETVAIASHLNLTTAFLQPLPDIDRPEDLWVWEKIRAEELAALV